MPWIDPSSNTMRLAVLRPMLANFQSFNCGSTGGTSRAEMPEDLFAF